jgi:hypothetical protein
MPCSSSRRKRRVKKDELEYELGSSIRISVGGVEEK